jgi:hypothetical protein
MDEPECPCCRALLKRLAELEARDVEDFLFFPNAGFARKAGSPQRKQGLRLLQEKESDAPTSVVST